MDRSPLLGRPRGCIYALGEPWGVLHLALHKIFLGRDGNLVSIKSASSRLSCFVALLCRRHISHVWTPNNANSVSWFYGTKFPPTLVFIAFLGNEDKISKSALENNMFWFRTDCATEISGGHISQLLSPNWAFHMSNSKVSSRPTTLVVKLFLLEAI
jgi:hypothetical protein